MAETTTPQRWWPIDRPSRPMTLERRAKLRAHAESMLGIGPEDTLDLLDALDAADAELALCGFPDCHYLRVTDGPASPLLAERDRLRERAAEADNAALYGVARDLLGAELPGPCVIRADVCETHGYALNGWPTCPLLDMRRFIDQPHPGASLLADNARLRERVAALTDAINGAVVELACPCSDAYTIRGRHEPGSCCDVGRDLLAALEARDD